MLGGGLNSLIPPRYGDDKSNNNGNQNSLPQNDGRQTLPTSPADNPAPQQSVNQNLKPNPSPLPASNPPTDLSPAPSSIPPTETPVSSNPEIQQNQNPPTAPPLLPVDSEKSNPPSPLNENNQEPNINPPSPGAQFSDQNHNLVNSPPMPPADNPAPQQPTNQPTNQPANQNLELDNLPPHALNPNPTPPLMDSDEESNISGHVFHLEVNKIHPNSYQPRRDFDQDALMELASSIREFGVLQPIVVTKKIVDIPTGTEVSYELIAGERRLRASKLAGLERIPAVIKDTTPKKERFELAIIENLQREDLNPIESARAFAKLQDEYGMTQREIASRLGKSREVIANAMRLLALPTYIQEAVSRGQISESQARLLMSITDLNSQQNIFNDLVKNSLSVRELRNRIISTNTRANAVSRFQNTDPEIRHLQEKLSEILGAKVKIDQSSNDNGKITISFSSPEELKNILEKVYRPEDEL